MNRQIPKAFSIALLMIGISISSCANMAASPAMTQLPTPPLATVTMTIAAPEPGPSPVESPTIGPTPKAEPAVTAPSGLQVIYLMGGNLWSWTEKEDNVMLTGTGDMTTARLSDDGQFLAFMRGREVWTVRMDGTDARLLVAQKDEGGALWFAPNGVLLAVSTADHIDVINLDNATIATVVNYTSLPEGYFPEVVWSADSSGFKTVIPPASEEEKAEFLFVFANGKKASLAKFALAPLSESLAFVSPDGGYVIYVVKSKDKMESLQLMDSSGATKPYAEPADHIRICGWLPDAKHFVYSLKNEEKAIRGNVTGEPPMELEMEAYETLRWLDAEKFLALQAGNLYLVAINGERFLIAEDVTDFDFEI